MTPSTIYREDVPYLKPGVVLSIQFEGAEVTYAAITEQERAISWNGSNPKLGSTMTLWDERLPSRSMGRRLVEAGGPAGTWVAQDGIQHAVVLEGELTFHSGEEADRWLRANIHERRQVQRGDIPYSYVNAGQGVLIGFGLYRGKPGVVDFELWRFSVQSGKSSMLPPATPDRVKVAIIENRG